MAEPLDSEDEHVRYDAYCGLIGAAEDVPEWVLDRLATDPDQVMADSVRIRMIGDAASLGAVAALTSRPDFASNSVRQKAAERSAVLAAWAPDSEAQLVTVAGSGFKKAQLELLKRSDVPLTVLRLLAEGRRDALGEEPSAPTVRRPKEVRTLIPLSPGSESRIGRVGVRRWPSHWSTAPSPGSMDERSPGAEAGLAIRRWTSPACTRLGRDPRQAS